MQVIRYPDISAWPDLLKRPVLSVQDVEALVAPILGDVRKRGDSALYDYTRKFDHVELDSLQVTPEELQESASHVDQDLKKAIAMASHHIEIFHQSQITPGERIGTAPGVTCWQKALPVEKVGLYIPGGGAPLFSTVLMLAIPARIAGCREVVLCTPPGRDGRVHPAILYAARVTGVTSVFRIGGAHAIAAMAYGTESVPSVYKIFGPGNQFVTAAKQIVARGNVAIDLPAGPSELAVIADESSKPAFVASDLLSQAEHGSDSQVILFTTSENMASRVLAEVNRQLLLLPRKAIASRSLEHSRIILLHDMREVIRMVNEYAPEHLIIATDSTEVLSDEILNAGSVFLGHYSPESAGDYASGTNHTLPTNGFARMYSGVNLDDFVKKVTFQQITKEGLRYLGPAIMKMAATEDLMAHSNAVSTRIYQENG